MDLKNYETERSWGTHTVRITLQSGNHKGHLTGKMGGNTRGGSILKSFLEDDYSWLDGVESDCDFSEDGYGEYFKAILKNDSGEELHIESELDCLADYIVSAEIIDYKPE